MRAGLLLALLLLAARPALADVTVFSDPPGARVYDITRGPEAAQGLTPFHVTPGPDGMRLLLRYDGFEDCEVHLSSGEQGELHEALRPRSLWVWLRYVATQKPGQLALTLLLLGGAVFALRRRPRAVAPAPMVVATGVTLIGKIVGDYRVVGRLGEGGFSDVYQVTHTTYGDSFALKVLRTTDADLMRRFQREMEIGTSLMHPNLVRVFATGEFDGHPYLVMELLEGRTLRTLLQEQERLDLAQIVQIFGQICDGLACAHRSGVVHRDLKPENVMLMADGSVRVLDFGVARIMQGTQITETSASLGTLTYMSPEHVNNEVTLRSDLYSIGVMLFEAVAGKLPLEADVSIEMIYKIMFMPPATLQELAPDTPPALCELVMALLAKKGADRPASAESVGAALRALI